MSRSDLHLHLHLHHPHQTRLTRLTRMVSQGRKHSPSRRLQGATIREQA